MSREHGSIRNDSNDHAHLVPSPFKTWFRGMGMGGSFRRVKGRTIINTNILRLMRKGPKFSSEGYRIGNSNYNIL